MTKFLPMSSGQRRFLPFFLTHTCLASAERLVFDLSGQNTFASATTLSSPSLMQSRCSPNLEPAR
jgi:hypothetical protein